MPGRDFLLIADAVAPLGEGASPLGAAGLSRLREDRRRLAININEYKGTVRRGTYPVAWRLRDCNDPCVCRDDCSLLAFGVSRDDVNHVAGSYQGG